MVDYYAPQTAADVTEELVSIATDIVDGWYDTGSVNWENVWERVEEHHLDDGREIDLGDDLASDALVALKRRVRRARKDS